MGVLDKLQENWDHTRGELERQRHEREEEQRRQQREGIETVRLEAVELKDGKVAPHSLSPLERILPEAAAKAQASKNRPVEQVSGPQTLPADDRDAGEPTILDHKPGGAEPPTIQPPGGSVFRLRAKRPVSVDVDRSTPEAETLVSREIDAQALADLKSTVPHHHERMAAALDGKDLFAAAEARARAAKEIEKLPTRENGERQFTIRSRSR